jgi:predicted nucleotidyltransferase
VGIGARQAAVIDAARAWAAETADVDALLLKGSLGAGGGDELSDVDLVVVARHGARERLWGARDDTAAALGRPLGSFVEAPWHAPYTVIVLYDGPTKVDLFFQDGEADPDPWLRDGFTPLVDKTGAAERLRERLATRDAVGAMTVEELRENDAHAWDWLLWLHAKVARDELWLAFFETTLFAQTILVRAWNELAGEPWRGATGLAQRLGTDRAQRLAAALPREPEPTELRRSLPELAALWAEARAELAARLGAKLADELMDQVLALVSPT